MLTRSQVLWQSYSFYCSIIVNVYVCGMSRLEGTEEKFRNRESRPEDLQVIADLREMVSERESLVKKLVVSVPLWSLEVQHPVKSDTCTTVLLNVFLSQSITCLKKKVNISSLIFLHRAFRSDCVSFVPGWQEVLSTGAGESRAWIQQGVQHQSQCRGHKPPYKG